MIFDVPDPEAAPSIAGVGMAGGAIHNVKLTRLRTQEEVRIVRQKARELRGSYKSGTDCLLCMGFAFTWSVAD